MTRLVLAVVALMAVAVFAACGGGGKEADVKLTYEFDWRSTPDGKSLIRLGATNLSEEDWDGDLEWNGVATLRETNKYGDVVRTLDIVEAPAIPVDERVWFAEWIIDIPAGPYFIELGAPGYYTVETHWSLQDREGGTVKGFMMDRNDSENR